VEAAGFLVRQLAILLGPLSEEFLEAAGVIGAFRIDLGLGPRAKRFDAHGLAVLEVDLDIEDDDPVFHVPGKGRCR
jgi:hypothetical protein